MADIAACLSSGKDNWATPDDFYETLNSRYRFILDAAADATNHKCPDWLGPGGVVEDALGISWLPWLRDGNVWLNPPYSRGLQARFVEKARDEAKSAPGRHSVVCLLPARTDTRLFHEVIFPWAHIDFIKGRLKFINPDGPLLRGTKMNGSNNAAPFPSMIVTFTGGY